MTSQRIDIHTHAMPDDAAAEVAARGFKPTGGYKISVRWTPQAALAYMDRQEIAAQVVSMPMAFAGFDDDPDFGTRVSRMINEGHAKLIANHPGRFGAFATLPGDGPDQALAEIAYALDELRLAGGGVASNVGGALFRVSVPGAGAGRTGAPAGACVRAPGGLAVHRRFGIRAPEFHRRVPLRHRPQRHQRPLHRAFPAASAAPADPRPLWWGAADTGMTDRRPRRDGSRTPRRRLRPRPCRGRAAGPLLRDGAGRQPQLTAADAGG